MNIAQDSKYLLNKIVYNIYNYECANRTKFLSAVISNVT